MTTRTCPICEQQKPIEDYPTKPNGPFTWMCRACERNRASLRKHGLTVEQKDEIATYQGGCAICGHSEPSKKGWVVDHDHSCCEGEKSCPSCRRGIICSWCNMVLANAFDRPQILDAAIEYLARHANGGCGWHMPVACDDRICGNRAPA